MVVDVEVLVVMGVVVLVVDVEVLEVVLLLSFSFTLLRREEEEVVVAFVADVGDLMPAPVILTPDLVVVVVVVLGVMFLEADLTDEPLAFFTPLLLELLLEVLEEDEDDLDDEEDDADDSALADLMAEAALKPPAATAEPALTNERTLAALSLPNAFSMAATREVRMEVAEAMAAATSTQKPRVCPSLSYMICTWST